MIFSIGKDIRDNMKYGKRKQRVNGRWPETIAVECNSVHFREHVSDTHFALHFSLLSIHPSVFDKSTVCLYVSFLLEGIRKFTGQLNISGRTCRKKATSWKLKRRRSNVDVVENGKKKKKKKKWKRKNKKKKERKREKRGRRSRRRRGKKERGENEWKKFRVWSD